MRKKLATTIVMVGLLLMAALPATAAAAVPRQTDLSSLDAIEAYLTSIGVDPSAVVVQQGQFNYAGPSCPGAGWNCTTASMVVQISTSNSGANIFDCLPAIDATFPALSECLIVQSSVDSLLDPPPTNYATCGPDLSDGRSKAKCTFRQTSKKGNNYAEVKARTTQSGGTTQSAQQDADITQTSDGGSNAVKIVETISQSLSFGGNDDPNQSQDAYQRANVNQTSGSGDNSSSVQQTQYQTENATSNSTITQNQNTDPNSDPNFSRNQIASITQTSSTGHNNQSLSHLITQRQAAGCSGCTVNQAQGAVNVSGQRGTVMQMTGSVTMTSMASLNEDQKQDAQGQAVWNKSQVGPQDCCAQQFGGTADNVNQVNLTSTQQNGGGVGVQQNDQTATCYENSGAQCTATASQTQNGTTFSHSCPPPNVGSCGFVVSCTDNDCSTGGVGLISPVFEVRYAVRLTDKDAGRLAVVAPSFDVEGSRSPI
jgi:hypothetical protein